MQFVFMPVRGTIDAVVILRSLQEEYNVKGKTLCICLVNLKKAFDRVPSKVLQWAMRKKAIPEVLAKSVMSLYDRAKTMVMVDSELSKKSEVKFGMHQEIDCQLVFLQLW